MRDGRRRLGVATLALALTAALPAPAPAAPAKAMTCTEELGKAAADRLVNQCRSISEEMIRPCNAVNVCRSIAEHVLIMCRQPIADEPPAFCAEAAKIGEGSETARAERYAATILAHRALGARSKERLDRIGAELEPLAAKSKAANAAATKLQAELDKELQAASTAYDKHLKDVKKPGAVGLDAARQSLVERFAALVQRQQAQFKDEAAAAARFSQLGKLGAGATMQRSGVKLAEGDAQQAKSLLDASIARQAKLTAKQDPDAPARVVQLKARAAEAAAALKELKAVAVDVSKRADALSKLANGSLPTRPSPATAKKRDLARIKAERIRRELEEAVRVAQSRRLPNAPSAKRSGCDLERVDFRNFAFVSPFAPKEPPEAFKDGKSTDPNFGDAGDWQPKVSGVKYFDLDGNGKKEAVVLIERGPSAHSGPNNELRFLELDESCRIQTIALLMGGVFEGEMKGKSYFYSDTVMSTPEGQHGNYASGTERVELRYVNGALVELGRKPEGN